LPGLVAQSLGGTVWQTDHQAAALLLARRNAAANDVCGVTRFIADWRNWAATDRYDIVLGADIMYERAMHFYLRDVFSRCVAPSGTLVLSDPGRPQSLEFAAQLESAAWRIGIETLPVSLPSAEADYRPVDVAVLTCTPPQR
jgi:predicted nicotinamide N-methyase